MSFARVLTLGLATLLWGVIDLHAESPIDPNDPLQQIKDNIAAQCGQYRSLAESATRPFEVGQARQGVEVACNCVPKEIDRLAGAQHSGGQRRDQAESIAREAFELCGARSLRTRIVSDCRADPTTFSRAEKREKYCQCIQAGMGRLSDRQIADESLRANQQYEAAVAARSRGESPPPTEPSMIQNMEENCRAQNR
jgi:hypothetical protein